MHAAATELAEGLETEHGIRFYRMRTRELAREARASREVYNLAWSQNRGFVPLTNSELDHMDKERKPVLDEDFA